MNPDEIMQLARDAETKRAIKEAIHEWLDERFSMLGRWTLYGFLAAAFAGVAYLAFIGMIEHK